MANNAVYLKFKVAGEGHEASVVLRDDHTWSGAAGGWMKVIRGRWSQGPKSLNLISEDAAPVGECLALKFMLAKVGGNGRLVMLDPPDAQSWHVWKIDQ